MNQAPDWFENVEDLPHPSMAAIRVSIPGGLTSEHRLFAIYSRELNFPGYFGWNWDALEECLRDLSWLDDGVTVWVVHEDLPFATGSRLRPMYLDVMQNVCEHNDRIRCVIQAAGETA